MGFILSPRAKADVEEIWNYTTERWGAEQAERYVGLIRDVVAAAAEAPRRGRSCDDIRAGYFRVAAGSHIVFYRLTGSDIEVVRLLHGRMDVRRHL